MDDFEAVNTDDGEINGLRNMRSPAVTKKLYRHAVLCLEACSGFSHEFREPNDASQTMSPVQSFVMLNVHTI
jgi:hypothetical protein